MTCDIEVSLHWRVVATNPSLEGSWSGLGPVQNKGNHIHEPFTIHRGCVLLCHAWDHTQSPQEGKGQEFDIFQCCLHVLPSWMMHEQHWSSLTSCVWPLCWGGRTAALAALGSFYFIIFFFSPRMDSYQSFSKQNSAGLIFLPSSEHYNYYLIFQNNTVAEIPTLRMQCFSVFIQPAVWIFVPCFFFSCKNAVLSPCLWVLLFQKFTPAPLSWRLYPEPWTLMTFQSQSQALWVTKNKLGSDLILFLSRGLFTYLGAWGIARERPKGVHSPGCASCARQCCCLILEKLDD